MTRNNYIKVSLSVLMLMVSLHPSCRW